MKQRVATSLLTLLAFCIPFEHKYDKLFRHFSKALIPKGLFLPHFFDAKIYFYPSDLIAIGLALVAIRSSSRRFFLTHPSSFLWLLFLFAFISILHSPLSGYSLIYTRLLQFLTPVILFSYLITQYEEPQEREKIVRLLLGSMISAALIQSVIALFQYIHQGPIGLRILGEPQDMTSSFVPIPDGTKWIFDTPFTSPLYSIIRVAGTLPHTNMLGGFLAVSVIACYLFFILYPRLRLFLSFAIPFQFFVLSLTYSRSALFGWMIGTLFWFGYSFFPKWRGSAMKREKSAYVWLTLLIAFAMSFSMVVLHKQMLYRGGVLNYRGSLAAQADQERLDFQNKALDFIKARPWYGSGFQQLSIAGKNRVSAVHNIYLYLAAELGLPAFFTFLFFLAILLWTAFKRIYTPYLQTLISIVIGLLFIGGCDFYPLLFQQGKLLFFLCAALLALHGKPNKISKLEVS